MRITVNGRREDPPDGATVASLLEALGMDPRRLAVERNRRIVRRADFDKTALAENDELEIVTLVGGG